jgi:hypothetical protein
MITSKDCFLSATENTYEEYKKIHHSLEENCFIKKPIGPKRINK